MINPGEQGLLNSPRFHRGQIVFREWATGAKEVFLIYEHLHDEWYSAYEITHGADGEFNLEDHINDKKFAKFNCKCRLMNESDKY